MSRDDRRKYGNDVFYEVWRSGGNPDRINDDRVTDYFYDGISAEAAASREMHRQRPPEPQYEEEYPEQPYPEQEYPEEPEPEVEP